MAYISHGSFDYRSLRDHLPHVSASLLIRCSFVAIAAAAAILALSEGVHAPAASVSGKSDRLAVSASAATPQSGARAVTDAQARVTTVERGAVVPLSPQSPFAAGGR